MARNLDRLARLVIAVCALAACDRGPSLSNQMLEPNEMIPDIAPPHRTTLTENHVLQDRPDRLLVELPNGLIVLAVESHAVPVVSAQVWIKTGSIYEQEHTGAGLSHFLEHLISGGSTSTHSEAQSTARLAAIGAQTNAATSLDTVHYYINTTSAYANDAIELLSDWMQNSLITQQEYERERSVIQREFEMGQGEPGRILWKATQKARYTNHPARHPVIGYLDEFLSITRDEIYDFYKRMYVPNNMVFVVVGDIDRNQVVDRITSLWSKAQRRPLPTVRFPVDDNHPGAKQVVTTADIDQPRLRLAWPGTRLAGDDDFAMDLLASVLGEGESSRLTRSVRDEQRLVNSISAGNLSFPWGEGFFSVDADVAVPPLDDDAQTTIQAWRSQHVERAKTAILDQINRVITDGVTPQELARAKRKTMASVTYGAQSAQSAARRLASDLIGMKDPDYLARYARAIQSVTAEAVQQSAAKFLVDSRLLELSMNPQPEGQGPETLKRPQPDTPPAGDDRAWVNVDLDNRSIIRQLGQRASLDADQGGVEVDPVQRHVLPNGLRVLIGRSTLVPAVAIQIYQAGGLLADPPDRPGLSNAMAVMRTKGTRTRTAEQIAGEVEDLGAHLSGSSGYNSLFSKAVCLKDDWDQVLTLLADVTLNPTFPSDEWQKRQPRLLASIDRQTDTWYGELRHRFRGSYFGDHPWSTTPLGHRQVVEKLNAQDLRSFHEASLSASDSVLVVFGDVQPQQVLARVGALFGSMPRNRSVPFRPADPTPPRQGTRRFKTSKPLAAVQVGFGPTVPRRSDDYPALSVLGAVLNRFPSGWLEQELRGRGPGLVYAVGAGQFTGLVPGYFAFLFNCKPDTVDEALQRSMAVIERVRADTVDEASLEAAKAKVLTDEFVYKQTNADRASDAAINELYDLGFDQSQRFRQQVESIDAQQLLAAAKAYLKNPVTVVINHALETDPPHHANR